MSALSIIVLAAGKGTRMRSHPPKVMHKLAHRPMIAHVAETAKQLDPAQVIFVVAPGMEAVMDCIRQTLPEAEFALQREQKGTGHAVAEAAKKLAGTAQEILVIYGDTPLLKPESLRGLLAARREFNAAIALSGLKLPDPTGYGRLVMERLPTVSRIVECKDASEEEKKIPWGWGGVIAFDAAYLRAHIGALTPSPVTGEYYLTELIGRAAVADSIALMVPMEIEESMGVNTRAQLAEAEAALQRRQRRTHLERGVTLIDPESVFFANDTEVGADTVIHPFVIFGPGVRVGEGVEIRSFCHLEQAEIGDRSIIGPYARLRPGTQIGEAAHIGNFVELKQATVAHGAKINHLSYVGDAEIGAHANIGAGTITCNYDGFSKHRTVIGEGAFIGSNTSLVAPVTVGAGAIVGAGSTITQPVPENALSVARAPQITKEGAAKRFFRKPRA